MKDKTTKIKTTQKATTSFSRLHQQQRTSLFTLLHHFVMYINKNTFIQVILEQFFLFLLYTKNYKKLQKAPLNRPVVTAPVGFNPTAVTSTKQLSHIAPLSIDVWHIVVHIMPRSHPRGLSNNNSPCRVIWTNRLIPGSANATLHLL